jgi:transposase InsO family protein
VLQQQQGDRIRVIAYASRVFHDAELRYSTNRKEVVAAIYGLKQFRQYLLGRNFLLRTDHAALQYLLKTKDVGSTEGRYLDFLAQFGGMEIQHRPGVSHGNSDGLSRRPSTAVEADSAQGKADEGGTPRPDPNADQGPNQTAVSAALLDSNVITDSTTPELNTVSDHEQNDIICQRVVTRQQAAAERARVKEISGPTNLYETCTKNNLNGKDLRFEQQKDLTIAKVIEMKLAGNDAPRKELRRRDDELQIYAALWDTLALHDGLLIKKLPETAVYGQRDVIVLPKQLRRDYVKACHDEAGHSGHDKTAELVSRRVYFPRWRKEVETVCKECDTCAPFGPGKRPRQGPMQLMEVNAPMDRISADLSGPHPISCRRNRFILTCMDDFSRYLIAVPIRNKYASTVIKALNRNLFSRWGVCKTLHTDRGTEFENKALHDLCSKMGIKKTRTSGYRPNCNGRNERVHRTINKMLAKEVSADHKYWDDTLEAVVAKYNGTVCRSTGFTPNMLFLGRETLTPLDLGISSNRQQTTQVPERQYVDKLHERLTAMYTQARQKSLATATRNKAAYDKRAKNVDFSVGQWVLVRSEFCPSGQYHKWRPNYMGPFVILERIGPVNYQVQRKATGEAVIVHADRLRPCKAPDMAQQGPGRAVKNIRASEPAGVNPTPGTRPGLGY